jgi:mono/diheme cytochrome c family protein
MKSWIASLMIVTMMFALAACSRNREAAAPLPTAVPVLEVDVEAGVETDLTAASEAEDAVVNEVDKNESDGPAAANAEAETPSSAGTEAAAGQGGRSLGGIGRGNGGMGPEMRDRHMAPIPVEYAGMTSPVAVNADSLAQGKIHFDLFCASCHGTEGLGDGPAAAALDPAPPMLAQTSLMTGDDYLFWRISEGGSMEPFNSAMPAWKEVLDEQARWDAINYARSLGGLHGTVDAGTMREEMQATMQAEMLASALDLGVIGQSEADIFMDVHGRLDAYRASLGDAFTDNMDDMQDELLAGMVEAEELTQQEADAFADIHARLDEAGVMQ